MLRLYMDHHVHAAITAGLRRRGIDCLTSHEDGRARSEDHELVRRATALGRVMVSQDVDMLAITTALLTSGETFSGLFYSEQTGITIGEAIRDLELAAQILDPAEMVNRTEFLPL